MRGHLFGQKDLSGQAAVAVGVPVEVVLSEDHLDHFPTGDARLVAVGGREDVPSEREGETWKSGSARRDRCVGRLTC